MTWPAIPKYIITQNPKPPLKRTIFLRFSSIEAHHFPFPNLLTDFSSAATSIYSAPMAAASAAPFFSAPFPSSDQPHRRHRRPLAISLRPFSIPTRNSPLQLPFSPISSPNPHRRRFAAEASIGDGESGGSAPVSDDGGFVGEDAASFDLSQQKLASWAYFAVILGVVLFVLNFVWIDNSAGGVGKAFLDAVSEISDSHEVVMLALTFIFALAHSGLASLRDQGEKLVGERAFRVLFAGVSLPLAVSTVVYFINHRYDGVQLWQLHSVPGVHQLVWLSSFISFFFLYPSTFNLLEVAAVDKPKMHLWETGIMRITRHPQMVGQVIWCLAHTVWIGNSVAVAASIGLIGHHLFGVWNGDRRLAKRYGANFEAVKRRTSVVPFAAILDGRQKLPDDYYKEFIRLPYLSITALTIGAYLAHPLMQAASFRLHW